MAARGGVMEGLDFRLKTLESLTRKIKADLKLADALSPLETGGVG